jgi:hypothetical protein
MVEDIAVSYYLLTRFVGVRLGDGNITVLNKFSVLFEFRSLPRCYLETQTENNRAKHQLYCRSTQTLGLNRVFWGSMLLECDFLKLMGCLLECN